MHVDDVVFVTHVFRIGVTFFLETLLDHSHARFSVANREKQKIVVANVYKQQMNSTRIKCQIAAPTRVALPVSLFNTSYIVWDLHVRAATLPHLLSTHIVLISSGRLYTVCT